MTHSTLTTVTAVAAVIAAWPQFRTESNWLVPPESNLPFIAMAISNGYCAYDTWDMLRVCSHTLSPRT